MKLTFLGTAAAEGCPALYCKCETCENARKLKGKNIRTRSQALINDDLLIDFSADTYLHVLNYGLDLDTVKNVIITHSHDDHLYPPDIAYRMSGYCAKREDFILNVYSNDSSYDTIMQYVSRENCEENFSKAVKLNIIEAFKEYKIGDYKIYPLLADHNHPEKSLIYIIQDNDNKTLLYAHDTGWFLQESWDFLSKFHFDAVSLDCTVAFFESERGHMGISCCEKVKNKMYELGCADDGTKFILNHFSHNGNLISYDNLMAAALPLGFDVSYDTKTVML